jgi:putative peptidoglycan lipid II flippase
MDNSKSIIKSFKNFFIGTLFSRFLGMARDISLAFFFGASAEIAAFMVAFRLANLFRRLFGESLLQSTFSPYFETLRNEDKKKASFFYRDLFFTILTILLGVVLLSEIILFFFQKNNFFISFNNVFSYTGYMMPGLIFICLYGLDLAFLQCEKKYFIPSVAPCVFNIVIILTTFFIRDLDKGVGVKILSISVSLAFLFQYLLSAGFSFKIFLKEISISSFLKPKIFSSEIKKLIIPIFLSVLGIASTQINSVIDLIFAKINNPLSPAYLWYSIRLYQLPLSLFAIGVTQAIMPPLTRAFVKNNIVLFKSFFNLAIKKSFSFLLPITVGIFVLGLPSINLIFNRGSFDDISLIETNRCLSAYGISLVFSSFIFIISSAFYAKKNFFYPTIASIISVFINIFLNAVFIFLFKMSFMSIAIATSISSFFNFLILLYFLKKEREDLFEKNIVGKFLKILFISILSLVVTLLLGYFIKDESVLYLVSGKVFFSKSIFVKLRSLFSLASIYFSFLFILSFVFKQRDVLSLLKFEKDN